MVLAVVYTYPKKYIEDADRRYNADRRDIADRRNDAQRRKGWRWGWERGDGYVIHIISQLTTAA